MATFLSSNLEYALGWTVVHSLWQATVLAFAVGISMIALRKRSAHLRYLVASGGLLATLAASVATFCFYFDFGARSAGAQRLAASPAVRMIVRETRAALTASSNIGFKEYFNRHLPLIVTVWLMGVALFTLRLLGGVSYVYYLKNYRHKPMGGDWQAKVEWLCEELGVRRAVELVESALVKAPMTIGALKPIILFPIGAVSFLSTEQVEAILAHELAHIRRFDYFFNILQSVVETAFYFHPAVWWLSATIRAERENCCDDIAVSLSGNSMSYAKALVHLQEIHVGNPILAMGFAGTGPKNQLLNRVKRLLNQPQQTSNIMEKLVATCLLLAVFVGATFSDARAKALAIKKFPESSLTEGPAELKNDTLPGLNDRKNRPLNIYTRYYTDGRDVEIKTDDQFVQIKVDGKLIPKEKYAPYQKDIEYAYAIAEKAKNDSPYQIFEHGKFKPDPQWLLASIEGQTKGAPVEGLTPGSIQRSNNLNEKNRSADFSIRQRNLALRLNQVNAEYNLLVNEVKEFDTDDPKDFSFYKEEDLKVKALKRRLPDLNATEADFKNIAQEIDLIRVEMERFDDGYFEMYPTQKTRFGWQSEFERQMLKDGLIKDPEHYYIALATGWQDALKIDKITYIGDIFLKYKALYEKLTGSKLRRAKWATYSKGC